MDLCTARVRFCTREYAAKVRARESGGWHRAACRPAAATLPLALTTGGGERRASSRPACGFHAV